jgi:1,5-anhydro-D-fructose reductase (1,5-anhydro-D-mannitol-forming)
LIFRVAILSFWHVHAQDYAREAEAHPGTEIVTVWDEDLKRGKEEAGRRGVPFREDFDELLAHGDLDGVVVTTPTTAHRQVISAAARAGKHVFTEKVFAPTLREAEEIVAEVERAGVTLVVSGSMRNGGRPSTLHLMGRRLLGAGWISPRVESPIRRTCWPRWS